MQGTFKDSRVAAKMAAKEQPRYRVLCVVKDWETGTAYHGGDVIALTGAALRRSPRDVWDSKPS